MSSWSGLNRSGSSTTYAAPGTTTKGAWAACTEATMEFKDFWQKTPLPWQLEDLTQEQIEVVKKLASKAFSAGKKVGKRL